METEHKKAHMHLIEAQHIAKVGHWDWNIQTDELSWSDEIYRIFGYLPQEFDATYDAFLHTIHPDDKDMVSDAVAGAIIQKDEYNITHRILLPDGTQKIVHEIGFALYDDNDNPIRMLGTVHDITKIRQMENEISEQKEAFEAIFENSSDGIILFEDGRVTACNKAIIAMLDAPDKAALLNTCPSDISPAFQPDGQSSYEKSQKLLNRCLEKGYERFE